jgi:lysophospholipase L1-like esterase
MALLTASEGAEYPSRRPGGSPGAARSCPRAVRLRSLFPRLLVSACLLIGGVACSSPSEPTPPPPVAPVLSCPPDVLVELTDVPSAVVDYPAPQVNGGSQPVDVACVAPSGSTFSAGVSTVTCTATDSQARTGQCSFRVNVSLLPTLKGTKVLTFGDSITWGVVSPPAPSMVKTAGPPESYPARLQELLRERYKTQSITVINEGWPGEKITDAGERRVETVVVEHQPDIVIILEGVNDLGGTVTPRQIGDTIRHAVRRVVRQKVPLIIVSTVLPGVEGRTKPPDPEQVDELNDEIRSWAAAEGAVLVDTFAVIDPMKERLIGTDGLHPTADGYQVMAQTFFEAIQQQFERPLPEAPAGIADLRRWLRGPLR